MDIQVDVKKTASGAERVELVAGDNITITVKGQTILNWDCPNGKKATGTISVTGDIEDV